MPSWLCKIWRFLLNVLTKIVDFISTVLQKLVGMVVEAVNAIADGVGFGNILMWAAVGLVVYMVATKDSDKEYSGDASYKTLNGGT